MARTLFNTLASGTVCLILAACGGGGGGDRASGVNPGPNPPNGPVEPEPPILPTSSVTADELTDSDEVIATMVGINMSSTATVRFTLLANNLQAVTDVDSSAIAASLAKLAPLGDDFDSLAWTSTIRSSEDPVCRSEADIADGNNACTTSTTATDPDDIADSARKVQDDVATGKTVTDHITTESGGSLVEEEPGVYTYTLITDPGNPELLSEIHRICLQISLNAPTNNPCIDFVPDDLATLGDQASSIDDDFYDNYPQSRQIVADGSCNSCHAQLAFHGGGRTATAYCVTCHNPVTVDANSANPVDFAIMVHRIHQSANLPSVQGGTAYKIWGFRNGEYDYSAVSYPQPVQQCTRCHAGEEDIDYAQAEGLPTPRALITPDGHNWATYQGRQACESCHDDKLNHGSGGSKACSDCHNGDTDASQSIPARHRDPVEENARSLSLHVDSVTNTEPGASPVVEFNVQRHGQRVDIKDSDQFDGKLQLGIAWDAATDFDNDGISGFDSLNIEIEAVRNSTALGDNRFRLDTAPNTIPAGKDTLGIMLFGHEKFNGDNDRLSPIKSELTYYASSADAPTARRQVVDINQCDDCHHRLAMTDSGHAGFHAAPAENPQLCAGCHGPGLGFSGVSVDFRILIHGVHAGGIRQTPYRDFDTQRVQYPGNLADCESCHLSNTYTLPTPVASLPLKDGNGDQYTTATAGACASCHDDDTAKTHMVDSGGAIFNMPYATAAAAIETCDVCHRSGASASVEAVHNR